MFVSEHLHKGTQAMPTISEVAGTRQGPGLRGGAGGSSVSGPLWPLSVARVRVSSLIVVLSHRTFGNSMKVVDARLVHGLGEANGAPRGQTWQPCLEQRGRWAAAQRKAARTICFFVT